MGGYVFRYSLANDRSSCGAPPATVTLSAALMALICVLPVFFGKHGLDAMRPIFQKKNIVHLVPASLTSLGRVLTFHGVKEVNPTLVVVVMQSTPRCARGSSSGRVPCGRNVLVVHTDEKF